MQQSVRNTIALPEDAINEITLALRSKSGGRAVWCVVEAEEDKNLYEKFFNDKTTAVFNPGNAGYRNGKKFVSLIVSGISRYCAGSKIFGIQDSDYSGFDENYVSTDNVFLTDARDMEMMLIDAPSVRDGLEKWDAEFGENIPASCKACRQLGYLRIFNEVRQKNFVFSRHYRDSIIWDTANHRLKDDVFKALTDEFILKCGFKATIEEIELFIDEKNLESEPDAQICRGHDVISILSLMMIHTEKFNADTIRIRMIDSYSHDDFKATDLYKSIEQWAEVRGVTVLVC